MTSPPCPAIIGRMTQAEIVKEMNEQRFAIERSMMYHERRVLFWEFLSFVAKVFEFTTTSAAAVFLFTHQNKSITQWVVLAAAFFSFLLIILDAQRRIKHNTSQRARFGELSMHIPRNLETITEARMEELIQARKRIEQDDGVILDCFNAICHNRQCIAEGNHEGKLYLHWWESWFGRFLPIPFNGKPVEPPNEDK